MVRSKTLRIANRRPDPFSDLSIRGPWLPGDSSYIPPSGFVVSKGFGAFVVTTYPPTNGVILYEAHNLELTIASYAAFALIAASASLQMEVGVSQELALAGGL